VDLPPFSGGGSVGRSWGPKLALIIIALSSPVQAQPTANEPPSQTAFRAVLTKYDELAQAENDFLRLRALDAQRALELAKVLGEGLTFDGWRLVLNGSEPTPTGGIFVRFVDPAADAPKSVRPTFWNSGPGPIMRHVSISARSPLRDQIGALKRGATVVVSGNFFSDENGGPLYESAKISSQPIEIERGRFRAPYFPIRVGEIAEAGASQEHPIAERRGEPGNAGVGKAE
jgi:hypothetical protein